MQPLDSKRLRILETENVSVDLEYNRDYAILHIPRVDKLTKTDYKKIPKYLAQWSEFFEDMNMLGIFAATDRDDICKLLDKLGFVYEGSSDNQKVYKWHSPSQ